MSTETWFLLFDGSSADGCGPAKYLGRTTDKSEALEHYKKCEANPYSTGYVTIVTDEVCTRADRATKWNIEGSPLPIWCQDGNFEKF